jgi:hypothetical protein
MGDEVFNFDESGSDENVGGVDLEILLLRPHR